MTKAQKELIQYLLKGCHIKPWKSPAGTRCFRLYDNSHNPIKTVRYDTVNTLSRFINPGIKLWKQDTAGRMTLNLKSVIRLHGNNSIRKAYQNTKKK